MQEYTETTIQQCSFEEATSSDDMKREYNDLRMYHIH